MPLFDSLIIDASESSDPRILTFDCLCLKPAGAIEVNCILVCLGFDIGEVERGYCIVDQLAPGALPSRVRVHGEVCDNSMRPATVYHPDDTDSFTVLYGDEDSATLRCIELLYQLT